ncbi:hypothetical protein N7504_008801 [Penicillium tannophilum]|nr:hypothetical protein N7504_008801 [Penicillium tannophilum]
MSAASTTIAATTIPPRTGTAGAVTSFVPLTTVFTANPVCSELFVKFSSNTHGLMGYDPYYGNSIDPHYNCNPSVVSRWFKQSRSGGIKPGETGISMGPFSCPLGWSTLASQIKSSSSTLAECCPPSFYLVNNPSGGISGDCVMDVTSGQILSYASQKSGSKFDTITTTLSHKSTVGAIAITGWNVNYVRSVATSTSAGDIASSATITPSTEKTSTSALSGGEIAGIVVAIVVIAVFLAIALFIFIKRRRKQHQQRAPEADSTQTTQDKQVELHGRDLPHELDQANMVTELPAEHEMRYELDGEGEQKK